MAFTQTDLDAVNAAISSGELEVRHGQKMITYRSADELLALKTEIERSLAAQIAPNRPTPRHMLANFSDE
jgi:hypothetical protein